MLKRLEGATIAQVVAVTGWQPHTALGAFAGALAARAVSLQSGGPGSDYARRSDFPANMLARRIASGRGSAPPAWAHANSFEHRYALNRAAT
jgi:hypothetical protein